MTDIDTIRQALEKSALSYLFTSDLRESAISALERVSALQAEMEATLRGFIAAYYSGKNTLNESVVSAENIVRFL